MDQADGTGWMALYAQTMLQIAVELAGHDPVYEHLALNSSSIPCGSVRRLAAWATNKMIFGTKKTASSTMCCACQMGARSGSKCVQWWVFCHSVPQPCSSQRTLRGCTMQLSVAPISLLVSLTVQHIALPSKPGHNGRTLLAVLNEERLRRVLHRMLDEEEFLSPFGIRSLSRFHRDHPFRFQVGERSYFVGYHPAKSESGSFGGNSNWRGPVWTCY